MLADPLENVDEVGVRVHAVQSACHEQTLNDADVFGSQFGRSSHKTSVRESDLAPHRPSLTMCGR
jgi:hypothetical protein